MADVVVEPAPEPELVAEPRFCARCERRSCVCICAALPSRPVALRHCKVLVLQHWREEKRATGTVRLLQLCLAEGCMSVLVDRMGVQRGQSTPEMSRALTQQRRARQLAMQSGRSGDRGCLEAAETAAMFPELGRALGLLPPLPGLAQCPSPPLLLFPGEGSRSLETVLAEEKQRADSSAASDLMGRSACQPSHAAGSRAGAGAGGQSLLQQQLVLIVVDGTWNQARQLLKRHGPALRLATRVMMMDCGSSRMAKIRLRQPGAGCVSTVEALAAALHCIEREDSSSCAQLSPHSQEHTAPAADTADRNTHQTVDSLSDASASVVLLRVFDEAVRQQGRYVPAGPLAAGPESTQRRGSTVLPHLPLAQPKPHAHTSAHTVAGAWGFCVSEHSALTASVKLVPTVPLALWEAALLSDTLDRATALSVGLFWVRPCALSLLLLWIQSESSFAGRRARVRRRQSLVRTQPSCHQVLALRSRAQCDKPHHLVGLAGAERNTGERRKRGHRLAALTVREIYRRCAGDPSASDLNVARADAQQ